MFFAYNGLVISILSFLVFSFILINKKTKLHFTWGLFSLSVSLWSAGLYLGFSTNDYLTSLFWGRALNICAIFIPLFFIHFIYIYIQIDTKKKFEIFSYYGLCIALFTLSLIFPHQFVSDVSDRSPYFLFYPDPGLLYYFFTALFSYFVILGYSRLYLYYKKHRLSDKRNQILYLLVAMGIGFSGGSTTFALIYEIPIYPFGASGVVLMVLITFYAITKHKLMDISIVINRFSAWLFTVILFSGVYAAFITLLSYALAEFNTILFTIYSIAFGLFCTPYFSRIRLFIQTSSEKKFLTPIKTYNQLLPRISKEYTRCYDLESFFITTQHCFNDILEFNDFSIFLNATILPDKPIGSFSYYNPNSSKEIPSLNSELISFIKQNKHATTINKLPKNIIQDFDLKSPQLFIPCFHNEDLLSIIFVDKKLSEDSFTTDDFVFFDTLSAQLTILLERIKPFEKVKSDFKKTQAYAEKVSQQEAFTQLSMGIAHEIRNPMSNLLLRCDIIEKKLDDSNAVLKFSKFIRRNIERTLKITDTLLKYGDPSIDKLTQVNINLLLEETLEMLKVKCNQNNINISTFFSDIKHFRGNELMLYQSFSNILINAVDSMIPDGGALTISTHETSFMKDKETLKGIEVVIQDTGCGIDEKSLPKIYDPFYTTKYKNTGLGLSISLKGINIQNGLIKVNSKKNEGTQFKIYIPY